MEPRLVDMIETYYLQDLIRPAALFHGHDFGDRQPDGSFGHAYDFLDYYFEEGGVQIIARHYTDEPGRVAIREGDLDVLGSEFGMRALMFLALRFDRIEHLAGSGYGPLPVELDSHVRFRLAAHMQTFD